MRQTFDHIMNQRGILADVIIPTAGSVLLHSAVAAAAIPPNVGLEFANPTADVEKILAEPPCEPNPSYQKRTKAEQRFIDKLTEDIQDGHLDSMTLGEWMIRAEVFQHNKETWCKRDRWDIRPTVDFYRGLEHYVHTTVVPADASPRTAVDNIFTFLQNGAEAPTEDYKEYFPVLHTEDDAQARPLEALLTGYYNCNSGTLWMLALGTSHPTIGDKLKVMNTDDHTRPALVEQNKTRLYETRERGGIDWQSKEKGRVDGKEVFIIQYLRAEGIPEERFPPEYRISISPAPTLFTMKTNWFGTTSPVGALSNSIDSQWDDVPYTTRGCLGDGSCYWAYTPDRKFDWETICDYGYAKLFPRSMSDPVEAWDYHEDNDKTLNACRNHRWQVLFAGLPDDPILLARIEELKEWSEGSRYMAYTYATGDLRSGVHPGEAAQVLSLLADGHLMYSEEEIMDLLALDSQVLDGNLYWSACNGVQHEYRRVMQMERGAYIIEECIKRAEEKWRSEDELDWKGSAWLLWRFGQHHPDVAKTLLQDILRNHGRLRETSGVLLRGDGGRILSRHTDPEIHRLSLHILGYQAKNSNPNFCDQEYPYLSGEKQRLLASMYHVSCPASPTR